MTGNMIGRVFNDRYKITDRIGIGGMAEVYRAQDNTLGRIVAVKTMLPQYAADPSFTQRFRQEAAAAANLQSPYIVNIYDWGQDQDTFYIVMEYIRGSDLKTAIKERGAINQRKAAEVGSQVCQALSVAHNLDIIHRDIKPQNIMIQPDGNAKVMDFGIARAKNSVKTQTSSVLGTAHYISPEQAQGKDLTPASDIYSLGIVLYEAVTGKLPFDGPDAVSVALKQVNEMPVHPSDYNPDLDIDLEDIILKALSKNPLDRFATANDMKLALNDYISGRPVNLGGFAGAETALMGAAAGIGAAGLAGTDGTSVMPAVNGGTTSPTATTDYRADDGSKKKMSNKKKAAIIIGIIAALAIIGAIAFALANTNAGDPIPDVTGKTLEEATKELNDAGFEVGNVTEVFDSTIGAGLVVSTDPPAGTQKEEGTKVNLNISKGPDQVEVPSLIGLTEQQALDELAAKGLVGVRGESGNSSDVDRDRIFKQSVDAGEKVAKDTKITYNISEGPAEENVPNVVGESESSAWSMLENAGFSVNPSTEYSDTVLEGIVISQNPSSGTSTTKGSTVNITISKGPKPATTVAVPNVVGKTQSEATSELERSDFRVDSTTTEYSDTVAKGSVIRQSPSANSQKDKNSLVSIVISKGPAPVEPPTDNTGTDTGTETDTGKTS